MAGGTEPADFQCSGYVSDHLRAVHKLKMHSWPTSDVGLQVKESSRVRWRSPIPASSRVVMFLGWSVRQRVSVYAGRIYSSSTACRNAVQRNGSVLIAVLRHYQKEPSQSRD